MDTNVLDIFEEPLEDVSLKSKKNVSYLPYSQTFNNSDEIRITCNNRNAYVYPSESYVYIEMIIDAVVEVEDKVTLVNNFPSFLFDSVKYNLNDIQIDETRNLGVTTTMKNYASLNALGDAAAENFAWYLDGLQVQNGDTLNFCMPLSHWLGFAEDYKLPIVDAKHELVLVRSASDIDAYFVTDDNSSAKIKIQKIQWFLPQVALEDTKRMKNLKRIKDGDEINLSFRSWDSFEYPGLPSTTNQSWQLRSTTNLEKPRFTLFGLQTDRKNNKLKTSADFDHCSLTNSKLHLNSISYPYEDLNLNFDKNVFALAYQKLAEFQSSYYRMQESSSINRNRYKNHAPIIIVDTSVQDDTEKPSTIDVRLNFTASKNIPAKTYAYCVLIHDRIVEYSPLRNSVRILV